MTKKKEEKVELPYEAVMERLTATVEKLEKGELTLEAQIAHFEEGVGHVRRGQALLDAAEKKVEQLLANGETEAFDPAGGDD